jgi:hypothetical protein
VINFFAAGSGLVLSAKVRQLMEDRLELRLRGGEVKESPRPFSKVLTDAIERRHDNFEEPERWDGMG